MGGVHLPVGAIPDRGVSGGHGCPRDPRGEGRRPPRSDRGIRPRLRGAARPPYAAHLHGRQGGILQDRVHDPPALHGGHPGRAAAPVRMGGTVTEFRPVSQAVEDYLKAIYRLAQREGKVTTKALALALDVAAPSVTAMVKRLNAMRPASSIRFRGVVLTAA